MPELLGPFCDQIIVPNLIFYSELAISFGSRPILWLAAALSGASPNSFLLNIKKLHIFSDKNKKMKMMPSKVGRHHITQFSGWQQPCLVQAPILARSPPSLLRSLQGPASEGQFFHMMFD